MKGVFCMNCEENLITSAMTSPVTGGGDRVPDGDAFRATPDVMAIIRAVVERQDRLCYILRCVSVVQDKTVIDKIFSAGGIPSLPDDIRAMVREMK